MGKEKIGDSALFYGCCSDTYMQIENVKDIKVVAAEIHDSEFNAKDFSFDPEQKKFYLKTRYNRCLKEFYLQFNNVEQYNPINLEEINKGKAMAGVFDNIKIQDGGLILEILSQDLRILLKLSKIDGSLKSNFENNK